MGAVAAPMLLSIPGSGFVAPGLFSIALLIFAFGIRGAGSATGHRPFGTGVLALLAIWTFADQILLSLGLLTQLTLDQQLALGTADTLFKVVLAAVASVQIARAGVIPSPWNWAPSWSLIAVIVPSLLQMLIVAAGTASSNQEVVSALVGLDMLVRSTAGVFLGIVAMVLATRPAPTRTVSIISPNG
ncbi:hypothetical protein [Agromyces humatus]|uniref:hypothetical protein n=1 Tax=Agromyces humatus TaxID=279573 RepID=UPI001E3CCD03|nr:hypothetical protein [Agromyces humatus]